MNHANDHEPGNAAQLERNGAAIREDMDRTLHALEDRFSPGQLLDRSMHYLQEHGTQMLREIDGTVRRHPVPVALAAGGLLWFIGSMLGSRRHSSADTWSRSQSAGDRGNTGSYSGKSADHRHHQTAAVRNRLQRTGKQLQHAGEQMSETVRGQPLAFGALAIVAGALLGALLPTTEYERRTLTTSRSHDPDTSRAYDDAPDEADGMPESGATRPQGQRGH